MTSRRTPVLRFAVGLGLVASLAACGGTAQKTTDNTVPATPDLTVLAQDIKFDKTEYTAKPGNVGLAYVSKGQQTHNLVIEDGSGNRIGKELVVAPGGQTGETFTLTAGTYKMYCTVPGHKASMNAVLTVA
jgi:plastocyanin